MPLFYFAVQSRASPAKGLLLLASSHKIGFANQLGAREVASSEVSNSWMRSFGWLTVRWLFALPVAIAIGIGFQYLSFGLNWLIDHSIALLPLGGFEFVLAIPFRLALAGGAGASGPWWGVLTAAVLAPRFKQGMGVIVGLFLGWWYVGEIILLANGARQYVDVFAVLSSYIAPMLGVIVSLVLLLHPSFREHIEPMTRMLDE